MAETPIARQQDIKMSSEDIQSISVLLVNPELFSGSADIFRTELKKGWELVDSTYGSSADVPGEFTTPNYINNIYINTELVEVVSSSAIINSRKVPIRLEGNPDAILSDKMWEHYIIGGSQQLDLEDSINDEIVDYSFNGVFSNEEYNIDGYVSYNMPFQNKRAKVLNSITGESYSSIKILPYYNYHVPEFYEFVANTFFESEKQLPNIHWYVLAEQAENDGNSNLIPAYVYDYITRDDQLEELQGIDSETPIATLLDKTDHQMLPPEESLSFGVDEDGDSSDDYMSDRNYNLRRYLSSSYINADLSASITDRYIQSADNLFYNAENAEFLLNTDSPVLQKRELFPYYIDVTIPSVNNLFGCASADGEVLEEGQNQNIRDIIDNYTFDSVILTNLLAVFNPGVRPEALSVDSKSLVRIMSSMSGSQEKNSVTNIDSVSTQTYKSIDMIKFLQNIRLYDDVSQISDFVKTSVQDRGTKLFGNFMSLLSPDVRAAKLMNSNAAAQVNTMKALNVINDTVNFLSTNYFEIDSVQSLYESSSNSKYHETIAFRIEKILNGQTIQNFWIYNSTNLEDINFTDSQVVHGRTYVYNIYKYMVSKELRYKFSNPVYSQQIATETSITDEDELVSFCLQFYQSETLSSQYFDPEDTSLEDVNTFADVANAIKSDMQYLADATMEYETGLRLYEIPISTKTVTIQDHPPAVIDVMPFFVKDNSKVVGFQLNYDAYAKIKMPYALDDFDQTYNLTYENSYDMLKTDKILYSSRSRLSRFEVFRTTEKPTTLKDFGNTAYKTYDMRIRDEKSSFGVVECYDKILTNKKYYYMFRAVNELEVRGPLTEVYEIELIDDGGYNYLLTKVYTENELNVTSYTNPTKTFKSVLHVRPAGIQAALNLSNVDYTQESNTQFENVTLGNTDADELIWGKNFKIRLKSKKTGKKIDLNITYNLENG